MRSFRYEGTVKIHKFANQGLSLKTWQLFFNSFHIFPAVRLKS